MGVWMRGSRTRCGFVTWGVCTWSWEGAGLRVELRQRPDGNARQGSSSLSVTTQVPEGPGTGVACGLSETGSGAPWAANMGGAGEGGCLPRTQPRVQNVLKRAS